MREEEKGRREREKRRREVKGRRGGEEEKRREREKGRRGEDKKVSGGWRYIKQYFRRKLIVVGAINFRR